MDIIPSLLAAHGLTGYDMVATYFGIGKGIVLKTLHSGLPTFLSSVIIQLQCFILPCYGQVHCKSLKEARIKLWSTNVDKTLASGQSKGHCLQQWVFKGKLDLCTSPSCHMMKCYPTNPHPLDATKYGWYKSEDSSASRLLLSHIRLS